LAVALANTGAMRIERAGQQRWLVVPASPEQLWPALKTFWEQKGYTLDAEDAKTGVMETNWSMNRAKLPADAVRNTLGRLLGNLYDTGERDRFRTRIERAPAADGGSEIYISHRGAQEVYTSERSETTTWRSRPSDPQLEAELLSQLMVALGAKDEAARQAVAASGKVAAAASPATAAAAAAPAPSSRAPAAVSSGATSLEVDDPFDRAWRRVGLALDRGGFTVEDRDRAGGIYYVRYVDPKSAGKEEPGFWARLFGNTNNPLAAVRYRVALKGVGNKTSVTVLSSSGGTDVGENGQRIAALLVNELR
jgi:outer membrane protein assembly factor BamC